MPAYGRYSMISARTSSKIVARVWADDPKKESTLCCIGGKNNPRFVLPTFLFLMGVAAKQIPRLVNSVKCYL